MGCNARGRKVYKGAPPDKENRFTDLTISYFVTPDNLIFLELCRYVVKFIHRPCISASSDEL